MNLCNPTRDDGFAAQYQNILFTMVFCELNGDNFIYRPFNKIAHNYNNVPNFVRDKENFINLINSFETTIQANKSKIEYRDVNNRVSYNVVESYINMLAHSRLFEKAKSLLNEGKKSKFDKSIKNIAVHIRRSNPHDIGSYAYSDNQKFLDIIEEIRKNTPEDKLIHIYSQGDIKDFEIFRSGDTIFHLNEKTEDTFYDLVCSDVLVCSKSSFSYTAGLLSMAKVYYIPFWHRVPSCWEKF